MTPAELDQIEDEFIGFGQSYSTDIVRKISTALRAAWKERDALAARLARAEEALEFAINDNASLLSTLEVALGTGTETDRGPELDPAWEMVKGVLARPHPGREYAARAERIERVAKEVLASARKRGDDISSTWLIDVLEDALGVEPE